jgi:hypothetical protein
MTVMARLMILTGRCSGNLFHSREGIAFALMPRSKELARIIYVAAQHFIPPDQ